MTISIIQYAVRVKGTQKYLPRPQRRDGRGGSHLEPVDFSDRSTWPKRYEKDMMIRTYTTRHAANNLLQSWLKGKFCISRYGSFEDYDEETYIKDGSSREHLRNDMEIVEIELILPA